MVYAVYLLFSLFVLSTIGYLSYSLYNNEIQDLKKSLQSYSEITEESMKASIELISSTLYHIDLNIRKSPIELKSMSAEGLNEYKKHLKKIPTSEIRVADANGKIIASTSPMPSNFSAAEKNYFKIFNKVNAPEFYISEPFVSSVRMKHIVVMSRKIVSANGQFLGVVWVSLEASFFSSYRERLNLGESSLFVVTTGIENRFAYRYPEIKNTLGSIISPHPNTHPVFLGKKPRGVYEVNSVKDRIHRYISISWVGEYPVLVIIGKDYKPYMNQWTYQSFLLIFSTMCALIVGFYFLRFFIKHNETTSRHQAQLSNTSRLVALGEMSASIAHEINNPLTIIAMNLQKLEKRITENSISNIEIVKCVGKTRHTAERITKIINGLRMFSRQQNSYRKLTLLSDILNEIHNISSEKFKANGIRFTITNEAEEALIFADETQIMQVLINLLNNSFDVLENSDNQWVMIKVLKNNSGVRIEVSDSGPGISNELVDKVMEPFFTTKELGKGTGLGLSISKGIIEKHQGKFWYDKMAKTTTFVIEIPIGQPALEVEELKAS